MTAPAGQLSRRPRQRRLRRCAPRHSRMLLVLVRSLRYPQANSNRNFDILNRLLLFSRRTSRRRSGAMRKPRPRTAPSPRVLDSFAEFGATSSSRPLWRAASKFCAALRRKGRSSATKTWRSAPNCRSRRCRDLLIRCPGSAISKPTTSRRSISSGRRAGDRASAARDHEFAAVRASCDEGTRRLRGRIGVHGHARPSQYRLCGDQPVNSMFSRQLSDIGLSQPIAATAIGRAYLAACTPADREAILQRNQDQDAGGSGSGITRS